MPWTLDRVNSTKYPGSCQWCELWKAPISFGGPGPMSQASPLLALPLVTNTTVAASHDSLRLCIDSAELQEWSVAASYPSIHAYTIVTDNLEGVTNATRLFCIIKKLTPGFLRPVSKFGYGLVAIPTVVEHTSSVHYLSWYGRRADTSVAIQRWPHILSWYIGSITPQQVYSELCCVMIADYKWALLGELLEQPRVDARR